MQLISIWLSSVSCLFDSLADWTHPLIWTNPEVDFIMHFSTYAWNLRSLSILFAQINSNLAARIYTLHQLISFSPRFGQMYALHHAPNFYEIHPCSNECINFIICEAYLSVLARKRLPKLTLNVLIAVSNSLSIYMIILLGQRIV